MRAGTRAACVAVLALGCLPYRLPPLSPRVAALPARVSQTGLYAGARTTELAGDVRPYRPAYELWSDGATKRRWIHLPAGSRIDTANMDDAYVARTACWGSRRSSSPTRRRRRAI